MSGQVYAVASGKGGVGKTTTAINLAVCYRMNGERVAVVDGDLAMPNLADCLGVEAEATLHDALAERTAVEETVVETAEGFGLLVGDRSLAGFAATDPAAFDDVIGALADRYDYVLVDTGAGLSYENALAMSLADGVVLVTTADEAAIENTRRTAELAREGGVDVLGVVLTRADDDIDIDRMEAALDTSVLATVPEEAVVGETVGLGKPLELHAPESDAAEAYRELVDAIANADWGDEAERDATKEADADANRIEAASDGGGTPAETSEGEPVENDSGDAGDDDGGIRADDGGSGRLSRVAGLFR